MLIHWFMHCQKINLVAYNAIISRVLAYLKFQQAIILCNLREYFQQ